MSESSEDLAVKPLLGLEAIENHLLVNPGAPRDRAGAGARQALGRKFASCRGHQPVASALQVALLVHSRLLNSVFTVYLFSNSRISSQANRWPIYYRPGTKEIGL
jgi:hypothetical protein